MGEGGHAFVWRADCAEAAARAVLDGGQRSRTLELTGPELISAPRFAALLEEVGGRPVEVVEVDDDGFRAYLGQIPLEPGEAYPPELHWTTARAIREGQMSQLGDGFHALTGRQPRSLSELFEANRERLRASI
jgi:NAD(P)H dehydrogenase (quinone)